MGRARSCRVVLTDLDGVTHSVEVRAATLFEAAAAAIVAFREHEWAAPALTPTAVSRVEVPLPPMTHEVSLKAVERWADGPSASPKEQLVKRSFRTTSGR